MSLAPPKGFRPWLNSLTMARVTALAVFAMVFLVIEVFIEKEAAENEARRQMESMAFAGNLRAQAERELNAVLFLSGGLSSYLTARKGNVDPAELTAILADLHANSRNVRSFGIAEGYVVRYVYPLAANSRVLGFDYRTSASQWPDVKRTIESRKGTLVGPVRLAQGGVGLIYRYPIFVRDQYWGMLSTVVDVDVFLRAAFEHISLAGRHEFAVATRVPGAERPMVFWGNPAIFQAADAILMESEVPNGQWVFAVREKEASLGLLRDAMLRIGGGVLAALLATGLYLLMRNRLALAHLALFDPLTSLPNRRLLEDRLHQAISRHGRREGSHCGVLFIDLDRFKAINDEYGHKAGDAVLRNVAQRIRDEVRAGDTVARWGGDELVVVVEDTDARQLDQLVARLRQIIMAPILFGPRTLEVGASVGVALFPADGGTATQLIKVADERMYADKQRQQPVAAS